MRRKGVGSRVEDVTDAAGAAKGTFYVYYRTWSEFLAEIRNEADAMVGKRFEELSKAYPDWRSLLYAMSQLHVQLVRDLNGLDVIYHGQLASQIPDKADAHLERLTFFLREAARADAIDLTRPDQTGRLIYGMILQTTEAVLRGGDEESACAICGQFIVAGLNARAVPRTAEFWPHP